MKGTIQFMGGAILQFFGGNQEGTEEVPARRWKVTKKAFFERTKTDQNMLLMTH